MKIGKLRIKRKIMIPDFKERKKLWKKTKLKM